MYLLLLLLMSGSLILELLTTWLKINPCSLNDYNTKHIYVGDDISLTIVGFGTIHLDIGQSNDVLCVPTLSCNLLFFYQITHSGEGKIVEFSPHDVVIKNLKDPKNILATGIANDSTRLYKFDKFGS